KAEQADETQSLMTLLGPSLSSLRGLLEALDAPPPAAAGFAPAGAPYASRPSDDAAQAVALTPSKQAGAAGRLHDRIFVLPPANASSSDDATADAVKRTLAAELGADHLAKPY